MRICYEFECVYPRTRGGEGTMWGQGIMMPTQGTPRMGPRPDVALMCVHVCVSVCARAARGSARRLAVSTRQSAELENVGNPLKP